jgi:hypothetical protein
VFWLARSIKRWMQATSESLMSTVIVNARKWFRQIARAAGIPDEVWSMDSRDGGRRGWRPATAIQANLTHSGGDMTRRYLRGDDEQKIVEVAEARKRKREADATQHGARDACSQSKNEG